MGRGGHAGREPRARYQPSRQHNGWAWGLPDLTITLPEYVMPAGGADVFRNFVVAVPFTGTRYVRGFQFRPRSTAVHHANIRVDRTPASEQLDLADPAPGYEGVILHSAEYPDGHFLGWTPGQAAPPANDLAWPLVGGNLPRRAIAHAANRTRGTRAASPRTLFHGRRRRVARRR